MTENEMNENTTTESSASETVTSAARSVRETASEMGFKAKSGFNRAVENGKEKADQARMSTASGLDRAASKVHETAGRLPGGDRTQRAAHAVASGMEKSASYLREHDLNAMRSDAELFVRRHPGRSLIVAAAVGFLLGQTLRRSK